MGVSCPVVGCSVVGSLVVGLKEGIDVGGSASIAGQNTAAADVKSITSTQPIVSSTTIGSAAQSVISYATAI